jgi:hypothetical protein
VRPNRNASPLPLLDHLRVSLFDESAGYVTDDPLLPKADEERIVVF